MEDLFVSAGMTAMTTAILLIEVASIAMMLAIVFAFRRVRTNQRTLLVMLQSHLRNPALDALLQEVTAGRFPQPRWWLLWLYVLSTLGVTVATLFYFVFQPHIL